MNKVRVTLDNDLTVIDPFLKNERTGAHKLISGHAVFGICTIVAHQLIIHTLMDYHTNTAADRNVQLRAGLGKSELQCVIVDLLNAYLFPFDLACVIIGSAGDHKLITVGDHSCTQVDLIGIKQHLICMNNIIHGNGVTVYKLTAFADLYMPYLALFIHLNGQILCQLGQKLIRIAGLRKILAVKADGAGTCDCPFGIVTGNKEIQGGGQSGEIIVYPTGGLAAFFLLLGRAACKSANEHQNCQKKCQKFFHTLFSPLKNIGEYPFGYHCNARVNKKQ